MPPRPGRTFDLAGHILAVADGVLPLQPVNCAQLDRVADELGARITAITPSENGVRLDGNSIFLAPLVDRGEVTATWICDSLPRR